MEDHRGARSQPKPNMFTAFTPTMATYVPLAEANHTVKSNVNGVCVCVILFPFEYTARSREQVKK